MSDEIKQKKEVMREIMGLVESYAYVVASNSDDRFYPRDDDEKKAKKRLTEALWKAIDS